ncbi:MAG: efflux RND transporter periplasmic adaptor subunit [Bacteroides sp.]|nr:efflux RND transporter periplasmic adaptor subunit [Bacteroides sp.]
MKTMTMRVCLFFCLAALLSACGQTKESKSTQTLSVKTAQVTTQSNDGNREFTFISKPVKTTELSFRVGGPIERFDVYAGNYYKRGEVIAQIDPRDFRIRKERAEAIYSQAKAEFGRIETLYEKNNLSASAYEKARADYTAAKTAFETATNELNDTRLIAPFNGYVGEVYIEKYQDVKATQPIISFIDIDQLKIETFVTQDIAFGSQKPAEVSLRFDADPSQTYTAKVVEISKSTMRNNISYLLTALLPNKDGKLLGGMPGKVVFDTTSKDTAEAAGAQQILTIPQIALCHRPSESTYVWVVNPTDGKVSKRSVTAGDLLPGGQVAITNGLSLHETVATSGLRFLSDGATVVALSPVTTH